MARDRPGVAVETLICCSDRSVVGFEDVRPLVVFSSEGLPTAAAGVGLASSAWCCCVRVGAGPLAGRDVGPAALTVPSTAEVTRGSSQEVYVQLPKLLPQPVVGSPVDCLEQLC